jgi:hypothetical protein
MKKLATIIGNPLIANGIAVVIAIASYIVIYKGMWKISPPQWARGVGFILLIVLAVSLLLLHEIIHMLAANIFVRGAGASLHIRLLVWECRLKKPLARNHYIAYALAPGIIIAGLSFALFYILNTPDLKFFAAISFVIGLSSAGGDYWFAARVLQFPRESLIFDNGMQMEIMMAEEED